MALKSGVKYSGNFWGLFLMGYPLGSVPYTSSLDENHFPSRQFPSHDGAASFSD